METSDFHGFHQLSAYERIARIRDLRGIPELEKDLLEDFAPRDLFKSDEEWMGYATKRLEEYSKEWGENPIGKLSLPLRVATNFLIDGKHLLVPMAIEEPSVVAGASYAAKLAAETGGFETSYDGNIMTGQIQSIHVRDYRTAIYNILSSRERIIEIANRQDPHIVELGGGAVNLEARPLKNGSMVISHLYVDVKDAMGANMVNTMLEAVGPYIEEITGYPTNLKILSNLADKRLVRAKGRFRIKKLAKYNMSGDEVAERMMEAFDFAWEDPWRASTHNKGIMNGTDATLVGTGQDWRAVEAGAHAYAVKKGQYRSLSTCRIEDDNLVIELELPMQVGTFGGIPQKKVKLTRKILGVNTAEDLARVIAPVGIASNFAAVRALSDEGIQRGHMKLHREARSQIDKEKN